MTRTDIPRPDFGTPAGSARSPFAWVRAAGTEEMSASRALSATLRGDPAARWLLPLLALTILPALAGALGLITAAQLGRVAPWGELARLGLVILAFQWGKARILQAEERSLWNGLSRALGFWMAADLTALVSGPAPERALAARILIDVCYALYFLSVLLAIGKPLDRRSGLGRTDLGWIQQGPGAVAFVAGLLIYFKLIPALVDPAAFQAAPPIFWLDLILDLYIFGNLGLLWLGTRSLRWQMLYCLLTMGFVLLGLADLLTHLGLLGLMPNAWWGTEILWGLALLVLATTARLRGHDFPPQESLFDSVRRKEELPWPRGQIVVFALAFPLVHLLYSVITGGADPSRPLREMIVLAWLVLVGALAFGQQRLLERRARSLWIERMRAEEALHKSEETLRLINERIEVERALRTSEEKFAKAFRASPDSVVIIRLTDGCFLDVNDGTEAVTGFRREELLGKRIRAIDLWFDRAVRDAMLDRLRERGAIRDAEIDFRKKTGESCIASVSAETLDLDGELCALVLVRDITRSRAAQEKIEEQAALLDKARDAILVLDLEDRIIYWNKSAERLYGWSADEVHLRTADELLYDKAPAELLEARDGMMGKGEWTGELEQVTRGGDRLVVESRWTLVRGANGRPKYQMAINTDVTAKKRLERQLGRIQRMESIATLAAGLAHDLNNVLTPIVMTVHLLRHKWPGELDRGLLQTLESNASRGAKMVEEVMSLSRGVEGERVLFEVAGLIEEIREESRRALPERIHLRAVVGEDLWPVTGDAGQIRRILGHLLDNAREALPGDGRITVEAENVHLDEINARQYLAAQVGPYVAISVTDTGVGIPPDVLDKIFDPFFTTKGMGRGAGLGLSSAMTMLKGHGGFMAVYSEVGNGSKFQLFLPATMTPEIEESDTSLPELPIGHGETVLVVDDEASIRDIAEQTLELFGYRSRLADGGPQAVEIFREHGAEIDLVMLDMLMPGMDGRKTLAALREIDPRVRVVLTSGLSIEERVADLDVAAFLPKPFTAERLLKALREVLTRDAD